MSDADDTLLLARLRIVVEWAEENAAGVTFPMLARVAREAIAEIERLRGELRVSEACYAELLARMEDP